MSFYTFRSFADAVYLLVALALCIASFLLVLTTLLDHLRNYKYPALQTCCMRILLLAPIYALVSWCMMVFLPVAPFLEAIRDLYETYTLYCFWVMLVLWCGGQRRVVEVMGKNDALSCLLCPLMQPCYLGLPVFTFRTSSSAFRYLRVAIMQLMVVKPTVALACAALAQTESARSIKQLRLVTLLATAVAMHSIFTVYIVMKPFTRGLDASKKFLGIKVVVAIILSQQVAVSVLLSADLIPEGRFGYTAEEHAQRLTCTATIVEMALFSLLLSYLFSHRSMDHRGAASSSAPATQLADLVDADGAEPAGGALAVAGDGHHALLGSTAERLEHRARGVLFEQVMGDTASVGRRQQAASELITPLAIFAVWDVLTMGRVEERSMQCGAAGIPLPVEVEDSGDVFNVSMDLDRADAALPPLARKLPSGRHLRATTE